MTTTTKNAVIYCRVSTKEQVEEGNSLVTQEKVCKEYALQNGYTVIAVFIEQGESAKTQNRTELQKLLSYCTDRTKGIQVVISYKIDRISRNTDDYSYIRMLLKKYGVEIKSTSEYFENTPAGKFMENIIANVAQFDNDVRTERCANGMKEAVREGRYVWKAPVGYSNIKVLGRATIGKNKMAALVEQSFMLISTGKYTIYQGFECALHQGLAINGKPISKSQFYRMLSNELYTGVIHKFGETHAGLFEPIVSKELFTHVQEVVKRKNKKYTRAYIRLHTDFPLRNLISTPDGLKMTGAWSKGKKSKYPYYRFFMPQGNISKYKMERLFIELLDEIRLEMDDVLMIQENLKQKFPQKLEEVEQETKLIQARIDELKQREQQIINKNLDGIYHDAIAKEYLETLRHEQYELTTEFYEKQKQADESYNIHELIESSREFMLHPSTVWEKATLENKVKLQVFVFPSGLIYENGNLRTPELCSIFKAKSVFLAEKSHQVGSKKITTNNHQLTSVQKNIATSSSNRNQQKIELVVSTKFLEQVAHDLKTLTNILNKERQPP
ncbi:MAG: hypothetical protein RJA07_2649 [Bacteroidota bacterium]|jgi:DNA invertase Pin-like site-specific DNA recombinase